MTDYEKQKVIDLITGMDPEEKKIALDILLKETRMGKGLANDR